MKHEKKVFVLEEEIDKCNLETSLNNLLILNDKCINLTKGQTNKISNYIYLEDLIFKIKKYSRDIDTILNKAILFDDYLFLVFQILDSDFNIDTKRIVFNNIEIIKNEVNMEDLKYFSLLNKINEKMKYLEKIEVMKYKANIVTNMIGDIKEPITINSRELIEECLISYNDLDEAKEYVYNYNKLEEYNIELNHILKANDFDNKILNINKNITLDDKNIVLEIYNEYLSLDSDTIKHLKYEDVLLDYINTIDKLEKDTIDHHEASLVDKQIMLTYRCLMDEKIKNNDKVMNYNILKELYDNLSEIQKSYLQNIKEYESIIKLIDKIMENKKEEDKAYNLYIEINDLPNNMDTLDLSYLKKLKEQYSTLIYKDIVSNITNLEILIKNKINLNAANDVDNVIDNISSYEDTINARTRYNNLVDDSKALVLSYNKLKNLEVAFLKEKSQREIIENINNQIIKLNINTPKDAIITLKNKCDLIGPELIKNYYLLEGLYFKNLEIEKGTNLENKILDFIKDIDLEDLNYIEDLYYEYECLSDDAKEQVDIKILDDYLLVLNQRMKDVDLLIEKINNVSLVSVDTVDDILDIRMVYELLDNDQKALVTNYKKLLELEYELEKLPKTKDDNIIIVYIDELIENLNEIIDDEFISLDKKSKYYLLVLDMYEKIKDDININNNINSKLEELEEKLNQINL